MSLDRGVGRYALVLYGCRGCTETNNAMSAHTEGVRHLNYWMWAMAR